LPDAQLELCYNHKLRESYSALMHSFTDNIAGGVYLNYNWRLLTFSARVGARYRVVEAGKPMQEMTVDLGSDGSYVATWMRELEPNVLFAVEAVVCVN